MAKINENTFGVLSDGRAVKLFTLSAGDISLSITELGAAWTSLLVPAVKKAGAPKEDILLGFSTLDGYIHNHCFFGATIGRFANRIGQARFSLGGREYRLYKNDGEHTLHGGRRGFSTRLWNGVPSITKDGAFVRFSLGSLDGDEGYPGTLWATVCYGVHNDNTVSAAYEARVSEPCPVNLTNHVYFNLCGEGNGTILDHELTLYASRYVEPGPGLIPTGRLLPVEGTPFDFRKSKPVAKDYAEVCAGDVDASGTGYDHCFEVDGQAGTMRPCAEMRDPVSGRSLKLSTTQPGVQFYSGNFLDGVAGKPGSVYQKNAGFCLETQHFPDSPNRPEFPDALVTPGKRYSQKSLFSLSF
jgi:aldose 1-epimerase